MSLVVTVYVREGIVMAADSRLTLTFPRNLPGAVPHTVSVPSSDSARKLFVTPNNVGISFYGVASINGAPIAGVVESFIVEELQGKDLPPKETADALLAYLKAKGVSQATVFHVAGYRSDNHALIQEVVAADVSSGTTTTLNPTHMQGANWGGEIDVFQRLLNRVALLDEKGQVISEIPSFEIPFQFFTLQDAVDFCAFAVRATIDTMRFQSRERTVGGPVDILVITPDGSSWIAQKQLSAS